MYYINIILFSALFIPYTCIYVKKNRLTPVSTFLIMEMSMFYGICFYRGNTSIQGNSEVGIKLSTIYVVAMLFFVFGVEIANRVRLTNRKGRAFIGNNISCQFDDVQLNSMQNTILWALIIVSILVCVYLLRKAGVNLLVQALRDLKSNQTSVYRDERMSFGSIPGIGYIYQFRVVILPLLVTYVTFAEKKKLPAVIRYSLFVFMIFCILCTGQRNAFVFFCVIVFLYCVYMKKEYGITIISKKMMILCGLLAFALLAVMTVANGRVSESDNKLLAIVSSILDRIFFVNQGSALTAFSYIDNQDTVWGYDWFQMLRQILPGKIDYLPIDNISYYIEYGTYSGTNPPCIWGSAWYNFSIFGITMFPFLIGVCYQKTYLHAKNAVKKNRIFLLFYVALCVYLGIWVYGTPMALFNQGVITVILMRWLICKVPFCLKK